MKIRTRFNGRGTRHYVSAAATDLDGIREMVLAIAEAADCRQDEVLVRGAGQYVVAEHTVWDRKGR